jgi:hypothetical protein
MTDLNDKMKRMEFVQRYLNAEATVKEELLLLDYYSHTKEELTLEEENVRLLLMTTNVHPRQTELSKQKEDEFDQLMRPSFLHDKKTVNHRQWLYPFIGAAAASLLMLLTFHQYKTEKMEQTVVAQRAVTEQKPQPLPSFDGIRNNPEEIKPETFEKRLRPRNMKTQNPRHVTAEQEDPVPDTLGNGIWKSEENVLNALEMLADCEVTIERGEQEVRNDIIQATFHAIPQPAGVRLVSNEAGDYEVVDPQMIIDL